MEQEKLRKTLRELVNKLPDLQLTAIQMDFMACMIGALMAALPCFLEAFMKCLAQGPDPDSGTFEPGERDRC